MSAKFRQPAQFQDRSVIQTFDDFLWFISPHHWTTFADSSCTATITANAVGGVLALAGASGTNNHEAGVSSTNAHYKFAANTAIEYVARIAYSEANTDDANVAVGLSSAFTTDMMVDDGAGPTTNHWGALIYKVDGGTKWVCQASAGTTQETTTSNLTSNTGTTYVEFKIVAEAQGDGNVRVSYYADDVQMKDSANNLPISHTITHTSASAMKPGAVIKNGGSNSETLSVDYIWVGSTRP